MEHERRGAVARLVVRMPRELVEALDDLGREQHRGRADLIRESVARYVDQLARERLRDELIAGYREWGEMYCHLREEQWEPEACEVDAASPNDQ